MDAVWATWIKKPIELGHKKEHYLSNRTALAPGEARLRSERAGQHRFPIEFKSGSNVILKPISTVAREG
jgi:hypothetical protein